MKKKLEYGIRGWELDTYTGDQRFAVSRNWFVTTLFALVVLVIKTKIRNKWK